MRTSGPEGGREGEREREGTTAVTCDLFSHVKRHLIRRIGHSYFQHVMALELTCYHADGLFSIRFISLLVSVDRVLPAVVCTLKIGQRDTSLSLHQTIDYSLDYSGRYM